MLTNNYFHLASVYSHLMRSIDYKQWAKYILVISEEIKEENPSVLELACGTGEITNILRKQFKNYVAADISFSMLKNMKCNNVHKVCCNMLRLPFKNKIGFVFSTFDSVNYLLSKEKILFMLKNVNDCLENDGIFTFDVALENNSIRYEKYLNRKGNVNGIKYEQKSNYNRKSRIHTNHFNITLANGKKVEEIHHQKIYPFEVYFEIIDKSNFYVHQCYEAFSLINATSNSCRAQFILKKRRGYANI